MWGSIGGQYGKYPAKIYTIDGVLIYQQDDGGDNTAKVPLGGVVVQRSVASSMITAIANPITFYGSSAVINQEGHSGDLYNYYWTSYSRGTDGKRNDRNNEPSWHNAYLDGYIPLRAKSIYDPCPYLYRIPSNGTYNQFGPNTGWTTSSYLGGASWNLNTLGKSWLSGLGRRNPGSGVIEYTGDWGFYRTSTPGDQGSVYGLYFHYSNGVHPSYSEPRSLGLSVRCIEDCDPRADGTPDSVR